MRDGHASILSQTVHKGEIILNKSKMLVLTSVGSFMALAAFTVGPLVPAFAQTTSTSTLPQGVTALYGTNRYETASVIANVEYPKGTTTAILTSGLEANWVDSITAAPLATALKAPILLTSGVATVGSATLTELKTLGVTKVYLIGEVGNSVNAPKIEAQLGQGVTATTISGATRFATAGLVAKTLASVEGVKSFSTVFIASADQNHLADALAADPMAAEMGDPILLVPNSGDSSPMDPNVTAYFNDAATGYLVGPAQAYLYNNAPSTLSLIPVYGQHAAGTASALDQQLAPKGGYKTLFITNGDEANLVDTLTAGPLIAMDDGAIADVYNGTVPASTTQLFKSASVRSVTAMNVVGGPSSIPQTLYDTSTSALAEALPDLGLNLKISVANPVVSENTADPLTLTGVPSSAAVHWSIVGSNASTGSVTGTTTNASFVGKAPGVYSIQAEADGLTTTTTATVYGEAAEVAATPVASTLVANGTSTDAVNIVVGDVNGLTVANFNGTVDLTAVSGVTYSQNGAVLTPTNGVVSVAITNGTATFDIGNISKAGLSVIITPTNLVSSNAQPQVSDMTYGMAIVTSVAPGSNG